VHGAPPLGKCEGGVFEFLLLGQPPVDSAGLLLVGQPPVGSAGSGGAPVHRSPGLRVCGALPLWGADRSIIYDGRYGGSPANLHCLRAIGSLCVSCEGHLPLFCKIGGSPTWLRSCL
jgi:hypothetical protein